MSESPFPASALIIGGAGFVGTHMLAELTSRGVSCTSLDLERPLRPIADVRYLRGDVNQRIDVPGNYDAVFNLAAVHRTPGHPDRDYYLTNVRGAINVTEFCARRGISTIVFTSSIAVYGPGEDAKREITPLAPVSSYGHSKALAEEIHRRWRESDSERRLVIARPAVTFGFGENGNFDRLLRALRHRVFVYPGRRDTIKSCGYVGDLVGSMLWAIAGSDSDLTFNFAYPERTTIQQIVATIAEVGNLRAARFNLPMKPMMVAGAAFEGVAKLGVRTGINRARIAKLVASTNVLPSVLQERGFSFATDLRSGVELWLTDMRRADRF